MTTLIIAFAAGSLIGYLANEISNSRRINMLEVLIRQKRNIREPNMWDNSTIPPIPGPRTKAPDPTQIDKLFDLQARVDARREKTDIFMAERERLQAIERRAKMPKFDFHHDLDL